MKERIGAFEGMGYTKKTSEDALGSRGQGKAAYLYHSRLPQGKSGSDDDALRHSPARRRVPSRYTVCQPYRCCSSAPLLRDEARAVVSTHYLGEGVDIDLRLDPLTEIGTRVIVPYLSQEVVDAFHSGELSQWLQRCWWRAVQMGLTIAVVDQDHSRLAIAVPPWWATEPWKRRTNGVRVYENIAVADGLKIKRIVLLYDESLSESDPDFWGVQLGGHQWIETLGQETLADYVPKDKRGFRGFVEFDRGAPPR